MSKKLKTIFAKMLSQELVTAKINNVLRKVKIKSYNDNGKVYVVSKDSEDVFKGMIEPTEIVLGLNHDKKLRKILLYIFYFGDEDDDNIIIEESDYKDYQIKGIHSTSKLLNGYIYLSKINTIEVDEVTKYEITITLLSLGSSIEIPIQAKTQNGLYKKIGKAFEHLHTIEAKKMLLPYKQLLLSE